MGIMPRGAPYICCWYMTGTAPYMLPGMGPLGMGGPPRGAMFICARISRRCKKITS